MTPVLITELQVANLTNDLNSKQPNGNYLTNIVGDGVSTGYPTGTLTLATVNSNVGNFGDASDVPSVTVNAKGLVTAVSNTAIQIAESQVTNLVSDLSGKQPTGNYITALNGDGSAAGPGNSAFTLATVNANPGVFGSAANLPIVTINAKGLATAATTTPIQIAEAQVTSLVGDLAGKQPVGNYITALSSDIVAAGPGSATATIQPNVVTNAKIAQMAANTLKGNNTAGVANASDLSASQVTAMLSPFVGDQGAGGVQGLVPAPSTGTYAAGDFLSASGTFAYVDQSKPINNTFSLLNQDGHTSLR
jgi:ribosomal protein L12E/L44/L45/RPP1/RPP2